MNTRKQQNKEAEWDISQSLQEGVPLLYEMFMSVFPKPSQVPRKCTLRRWQHLLADRSCLLNSESQLSNIFYFNFCKPYSNTFSPFSLVHHFWFVYSLLTTISDLGEQTVYIIYIFTHNVGCALELNFE
jgi:hypothetical protein